MSRSALILFASASLIGGCAAIAFPDDGPFTEEPDGGVPSHRDVGFGADRSENLGGDSCFNFDDEDLDGLLDCRDVNCRRREQAACCVGIATSDCCALVDETRDVVSCASEGCLAFEGANLRAERGNIFNVTSSCTAATRAFGPIGDDANHGRVILPRDVSPATSFLTVRGTIHVGTSAAIAAAGFGVFAPQGIGSRMSPVIAVVASASTNELRVIAGDRVIATRPFASDECARTVALELALAPDGSFTLARTDGAMERVTDRYDAVPSARVAMFGQQPNPVGDPDLAWVAGLSVSTRACDMLLPERSTTSLAGDATHDITDFAIYMQPDGEGRDALVAEGGRLFWFDVRSDGGQLNNGPTPFAAPIAFDGDVRDVDVFADAGGSLMVVLAVRNAITMNTRLVLARLRYAVGNSTPAIVDPADLINPSGAQSDEFISSFTSVDSPSAILFGGEVRVAFRAHEGSRTSLHIATINGGSYALNSARVSSAFADGSIEEGIVHVPSGAVPDAFDRDEVADPELFVENSVLRVLFAGRRGTRWSIGTLVASADATKFAPAESPAFGGSGLGFDALGALAPELVVLSDSYRFYYLGTDGVRRRVGLATQPR